MSGGGWMMTSFRLVLDGRVIAVAPTGEAIEAARRLLGGEIECEWQTIAGNPTFMVTVPVSIGWHQ